jgi:hypothetical protein
MRLPEFHQSTVPQIVVKHQVSAAQNHTHLLQEHTIYCRPARQIALAHLQDRPDYYEALSEEGL